MTKEAGHDLLLTSLSVAVPLLIDELRGYRGDTRRELIERWAEKAIDPICAEADAMLFGGGKKGQAAEVFNHVARGLAALSFSPGGVTFSGLHWEATCEACASPGACGCGHCRPHHKPKVVARPCELCDCDSWAMAS